MKKFLNFLKFSHLLKFLNFYIILIFFSRFQAIRKVQKNREKSKCILRNHKNSKNSEIKNFIKIQKIL